MTEPYPGYADNVGRWDAVRAECCLPGWLDHIKVATSPYEVIMALRMEIEMIKNRPHGFIVAGAVDHEGDTLLSAHGTLEGALAALPGRIIGNTKPTAGYALTESGERVSGLYDYYKIIDVATLSEKDFGWVGDRTGAPVWGELREQVGETELPLSEKAAS